MARYEVKVKVFDVEEDSSAQARARVDQALREAGMRRSHVVRVRNLEQRARKPGRNQAQRLRAARRRDPNVGSVALVAAMIAWWLYIVWAMA